MCISLNWNCYHAEINFGRCRREKTDTILQRRVSHSQRAIVHHQASVLLGQLDVLLLEVLYDSVSSMSSFVNPYKKYVCVQWESEIFISDNAECFITRLSRYGIVLILLKIRGMS